MMYWMQIIKSYITAIGTGRGNIEITQQEYERILSMLRNPHEAPDGYIYRLTEKLEWELNETPAEPEEAEASEADYQAALAQMGVMLDGD